MLEEKEFNQPIKDQRQEQDFNQPVKDTRKEMSFGPDKKPIESQKPKFTSKDYGNVRVYPNQTGSNMDKNNKWIGKHYSLMEAHNLNDDYLKKNHVGKTKAGADVYKMPDGYLAGNPRINSASFKTMQDLEDFEKKSGEHTAAMKEGTYLDDYIKNYKEPKLSQSKPEVEGLTDDELKEELYDNQYWYGSAKNVDEVAQRLVDRTKISPEKAKEFVSKYWKGENTWNTESPSDELKKSIVDDVWSKYSKTPKEIVAKIAEEENYDQDKIEERLVNDPTVVGSNNYKENKVDDDEDDGFGYLDPRSGEIVSKKHFEKYVKPNLTEEQLRYLESDDENIVTYGNSSEFLKKHGLDKYFEFDGADLVDKSDYSTTPINFGRGKSEEQLLAEIKKYYPKLFKEQPKQSESKEFDPEYQRQKSEDRELFNKLGQANLGLTVNELNDVVAYIRSKRK